MEISVEQKYETLVRLAPDAISLIDVDSGEVVEVNDEAVELLGYSRSALEGMPVTDLHPDDRVAEYRRIFEEAATGEFVEFSELPDGEQASLVDSDGEQIPIEIRARKISVGDDEFVYSIFRDVSEHKKQEQRVDRLVDELAVVNRLVRHDIRNDMTVILAWLEELQSELGEAHADTIDLLVRRSQSIVELTETVRDYVEILLKESEPELRPVGLDEVVEEVTLSIRQAYGEATVTLDHLPAVDVRATPMLSSVFRNLLHNAIQHNDKTHPEVEVTVTEDEETVTVHVADNGPGVPDARKEAIFGRDERSLDSTGTGIGLYLVETLVEQFGGAVDVADNTPEGAVFSVELQRAAR